MEEISKLFTFFVTFMNEGGIVMWSLFTLNLMLWYGIGYRYFALQRGRRGTVRFAIVKYARDPQSFQANGMIGGAIISAFKADREAEALKRPSRPFIDDALAPYQNSIKSYSILVKTIVVLAPLVGLLGTVMGMIETFDALQSSSMFSQGDSISGGISKALFTTELGLVVAVPGLILGRALDKMQNRLSFEFEQITDIICTKDYNA